MLQSWHQVCYAYLLNLSKYIIAIIINLSLYSACIAVTRGLLPYFLYPKFLCIFATLFWNSTSSAACSYTNECVVNTSPSSVSSLIIDIRIVE